MPEGQPAGVTALLQECRGGNRDAVDRLLGLVYGELRSIARARLALERPGHTLEPTALVHEAYMKMAGLEQGNWECRAQFFGFASHVIRNILVDHARARGRKKRGSGRTPVSLEDVLAAPEEHDAELMALHEALDQLAERDERQSKIVEMRFFGGLSIEETAHVMDLSVSTVKNEWRMARAWLYRQLEASGER
ncbi:MAG: sigma-70 family RNA polymerase sigma factor [Bryobacteraceae bacterium]